MVLVLSSSVRRPGAAAAAGAALGRRLLQPNNLGALALCQDQHQQQQTPRFFSSPRIRKPSYLKHAEEETKRQEAAEKAAAKKAHPQSTSVTMSFARDGAADAKADKQQQALEDETRRTPTTRVFYTPLQKTVMGKCRELHASIMPLNQRLRGPLAPHSDRGTALPFVLLVGNHSSGKSSFINYVLGRKIQTAGVAPTDDAFTIIAPGPLDRDQDGPSLVGDPDLGFQQLRQFGPTLMHHTALKIRTDINSNFIMVDSPGMIDSPGNYSGMVNKSSNVPDRGYDFTGVVRWFADRADIVCLFFDPDKPGTTGETLSILLHALTGMDHKLLIVLNKADQFEKIHDFARAYGSLCWNLSKVIPRKDLPRIYTMCLPVAENQHHAKSSGYSSEVVVDEVPHSLQDLHTARDQVVDEIRKAPQRRMDNVLTHLHDSIAQLTMHARILQDLKSRYNKFWWSTKYRELGVLSTGGISSTLLTVYGEGMVPMPITGSIVGTTILATAGFVWYHSQQLNELQRQSRSTHELASSFQRTYAREIADGDEYTAAVWQRVQASLMIALDQVSISQMPTVADKELQQLDAIVQNDIPALRKEISPEHYGKDAVTN